MKHALYLLPLICLISLTANGGVVEDTLKKYDSNGDGQWNSAELTSYLQAEGSLAKAFAKMNTDKSNDRGEVVVTAKEAKTAIAKQGKEELPKYEIRTDGVMDSAEAKEYFKENSKPLAEAMEEERKKNDPFLRLFGKGFKVRNSLLVDKNNIDKPASLGFAWDGNAGTTSYFVDGAIQYEVNLKNGVLAPTLEAHISDDAKATRDTLIVAMPYWWTISPGSDVLTEPGPDGNYSNTGWSGISHTFQLTPQYMRDRVGDVELFQVGFTWTPDVPPLGIGVQKWLGGRLMWRPWFGVDYAHAIETTSATLAKIGDDDMFRPYVKVGASLTIIPQRWLLSGNATWRHEFGGSDRDLFYWGVSSDFFLDKDQHFSINVSYEEGKNEPKFEDVEILRAGLGIKF